MRIATTSRTRAGALRLAAVLVIAAPLSGCIKAMRRDRAVTHYIHGQVLADRGQVEAALKELAKAIEDDPDLSVAHAAVGDIYRGKGEYDQARKSYESACNSDPYAFRPHYNLGVTHQFLAEAAKIIEKANRHLRLAVKVYLRAVSIEPADFDTNLNLSACYFQLGKYDLAEQYCKEAIQAAPDRPEAFSNLGVIYDAQNRLYEAIKAYKDSLELDTKQPNLLLNLGSTYLRQNRVKQAIRAFDLAARADPDSPDPWEQIGVCRYHQRRYPEALAAFRTALKIDPASAAAHRGIGVIYMSQFIIDRGRTELRDKALAAWHASLEYKPNQQDLLQLVRKYEPDHAGPKL